MCQMNPAAPHNPAVTAARFPDNHVFLLNLSFSCIYDKCSIYFFYCLEEKSVIISQLEGKKSPKLPLKKSVHQTSMDRVSWWPCPQHGPGQREVYEQPVPAAQVTVVGVGARVSSLALETHMGRPLRAPPAADPSERASPPFSNAHEVVRLTATQARVEASYTSAQAGMSPPAPPGPPGGAGRLIHKDLQT